MTWNCNLVHYTQHQKAPPLEPSCPSTASGAHHSSEGVAVAIATYVKRRHSIMINMIVIVFSNSGNCLLFWADLKNKMQQAPTTLLRSTNVVIWNLGRAFFNQHKDPVRVVLLSFFGSPLQTLVHRHTQITTRVSTHRQSLSSMFQPIGHHGSCGREPCVPK